jgi:hypothetical protein
LPKPFVWFAFNCAEAGTAASIRRLKANSSDIENVERRWFCNCKPGMALLLCIDLSKLAMRRG